MNVHMKHLLDLVCDIKVSGKSEACILTYLDLDLAGYHKILIQ